MKSYNIAIIPGDGVGGEIAKEAVKVMDAVADKYGFSVTSEHFDRGCDQGGHPQVSSFFLPIHAFFELLNL